MARTKWHSPFARACSAKQKGQPRLMLPISPKHEKFCQGIAAGQFACAAYLEHVSQGGTTKTAMEAASRLLADCKIAARIAELQTSFAEVLEKKLGVKRETIARSLVEIIKTPVGEVDETSPLCQEYKRSRRVTGAGEDAAEWQTEHVKTPSKIDAIDRLNKMAGWYEPELHDHDGRIVIEVRNL